MIGDFASHGQDLLCELGQHVLDVVQVVAAGRHVSCDGASRLVASGLCHLPFIRHPGAINCFQSCFAERPASLALVWMRTPISCFRRFVLWVVHE